MNVCDASDKAALALRLPGLQPPQPEPESEYDEEEDDEDDMDEAP